MFSVNGIIGSLNSLYKDTIQDIYLRLHFNDDVCCLFKLQKEQLFRAQSIRLTSICLPGCHISRIFFVSPSVCFTPWLQATVFIHHPALRLPFSSFSRHRNKAARQLSPQERRRRSADRNQNPNTSKVSVAFFVQAVTEVCLLSLSLRWLFIHRCQFVCCRLVSSENVNIFKLKSVGKCWRHSHHAHTDSPTLLSLKQA